MRPCRRSLAAVLVGLAVLTVGGAAAAEAVVLSATAPGLARGQVVRQDEEVVLPEEASAAFLLPSGQMVRLVGPYQGPVRPEAAAAGQVLSLMSAGAVDLSAIGGVRAGFGVATPELGAAAPVRIDVARPGTWCAAPDSILRLVRSGPSEAATLVIEDGRAAATLEWPEGGREQPWPASLEPRDGAIYGLRWRGGAVDQRLVLRLVTRPAGGDLAWLATMASLGCSEQAAPLLAALGAEAMPLSLYLSSDRGRRPRYGPDDEFSLILRANRNAHVYCFLMAEAATAAPDEVSPTGLPGGFTMAADTTVRIPGRRLPLGALPVPGTQRQVRCHATEQDVADRLFPQLAAAEPADAGRRLDEAFAALPRVRSAEARLTLRFE